MKSKFLLIIAVSLLSFPKLNFGQAINLGAAAQFVFFTIDGAIGDNAVSHSQVTGDVGYENSGAFTGFSNVNGVIHPGVDAATTAAGLALPNAIIQINAKPVDFPTFSGTLGNGQILVPGVYSIPGAATQNLNLYLDAQGDPNAEFIIKIAGTFDAAANSKVILLNKAMACHVYWKVDLVVSMATGAVMRGNILGGAAINMSTLDTLEGRALTTIGAITIDGVLAYTPIGCGSPILTGPVAPDLASIACYTIFSSNGALTNTIPTAITGDVGKNNDGAAITGWSPAYVTGTLHSTQDASTIQGATDLSNAYNSLNALIPDIELLHPNELGHNLVLTPHTYLINSAGSAAGLIVEAGAGPAYLNDSLYLDAQGNPDGVFVIKVINGPLTTSVNSRIKLINGAQSKNVYWMVQGHVGVNNNSIFRGTIVVPNGAIDLLNTNIVLDGRALTMIGAITTTGLTASASCGTNIIAVSNSETVCAGSSVTFTVSATGTNITYQWKKGNVNVNNGVNISGATTATLTINSAAVSDSSSFYNVVVSGSIAPNVTSTTISLVVNTAPTITLQPTGNTICSGSTVSFNVAATGTGLTYQWRKGITPLSNGVNVSGVTSPTLTLNAGTIADTAFNYNVVVSGVCSPSTTSVNVKLAVDLIPAAIASSNSPVCTSTPLNLTAQAVAGGTYTWTGPNGYTSSSENSVITSSSIINAGTYTLMVSVNGCISGSTTSTVVVNNCADLSIVKAVNNAYPIIGHTAVFTIAVTNNGASDATEVAVNDVLQSGYTYVSSTITTGTYDPSAGVWTIGNLNNGASATLSVTVTVVADGNYVNTATIYSNDVDVNMVNNVSTIETQPTDFNIPEGFSPDADGINDVYVIRGIDSYPDNTFTIFNRWGSKVFDAKPYINTWDGKATKGVRIEGNELPIGTYFYTLDLGDGSPVFKGTIYLNK